MSKADQQKGILRRNLNQYVIYPKLENGKPDQNHAMVFYGKNKLEAIQDMINWMQDSLDEINNNNGRIKDSTFDDEYKIVLTKKNFRMESKH